MNTVFPRQRPTHDGRLRSWWTRLNERWYRVRTTSYGERASAADAELYLPTGYRLLRRTSDVLAANISSRDVLYDIGCGKGRVLAVMARLPFARIVGVEVDSQLANAARENIRRMRRPGAPIEIRCESALDTDLDDGTVFFLDNPFGISTTREFVRKLGESVSRRSRRVVIAYHNPAGAELLDGADFLERFCTLTAGSKGEVVFWCSKETN